jgi:hypothetical protein
VRRAITRALEGANRPSEEEKRRAEAARQTEEARDDGGAQPETTRAEFELDPDTIFALSKEFAGRQYVYVYPDIPPEKEMNARAVTGVPPDELVWILIDYTVFGGARDCLLAGRHGIFHRGGFWRSSVAIRYEDLKDAAIIDYGQRCKDRRS